MNRTLGPRDVGGILKETFTIYKNNFWKLAAIVSIVTVPSAVIGLIFNLLFPIYGNETTQALSKAIFLIPVNLIALVAIFLMYGAVIHGVSQQYFNQPISIGRAYSFAWRRLGTILGASFLVILAVIGLWITFIGIPVAIYFGITWVFILQVALLEGCGPRAALSNSSALVSQNWWRVLGIILLFYVIAMAIMMTLYAPAMIGYMTWSLPGIMTGTMTGAISQPPAWILITITIGALIGNIIATPIFATGQTLLYFDLRVRKEGYSLDALANELGLTSAPTDTGASLPG
jgi:hypothetical protein